MEILRIAVMRERVSETGRRTVVTVTNNPDTAEHFTSTFVLEEWGPIPLETLVLRHAVAAAEAVHYRFLSTEAL